MPCRTSTSARDSARKVEDKSSADAASPFTDGISACRYIGRTDFRAQFLIEGRVIICDCTVAWCGLRLALMSTPFVGDHASAHFASDATTAKQRATLAQDMRWAFLSRRPRFADDASLPGHTFLSPIVVRVVLLAHVRCGESAGDCRADASEMRQLPKGRFGK